MTCGIANSDKKVCCSKCGRVEHRACSSPPARAAYWYCSTCTNLLNPQEDPAEDLAMQNLVLGGPAPASWPTADVEGVKELFKLRRGQLFYYTEAGERLVPRPIDRPAIIEDVHATLQHAGHQRTLKHLMETYWWPGMAANVASFVKDCLPC